MSTPVTEIWADILMLPIVGFVDSKRAHDIMNAVLMKIAESHSRFMILDISGVAIMDTAVANHLIKITKATRLMGCVCTISGVSPAIAETIVSLGIDIGNIRTTATLKDALHLAFAETGVRLESTK
jgi:rsbT co-antagonist protein RsbR